MRVGGFLAPVLGKNWRSPPGAPAVWEKDVVGKVAGGECFLTTIRPDRKALGSGEGGRNETRSQEGFPELMTRGNWKELASSKDAWVEDVWDSSVLGEGGWSLCFSRPLNDWEGALDGDKEREVHCEVALYWFRVEDIDLFSLEQHMEGVGVT
ncbi:hypothetical protein CK203_096692 [Vitis vinifera]|uniref:Uncharacterized protein n=1 Tax=Vitis vinifera TaxID=29760 RepID=A0A438C2X9_VITVI|nr:hypothetical protein CK203_096692 [Vitis vinifera]